jgi:cell division septation protein DedD
LAAAAPPPEPAAETVPFASPALAEAVPEPEPRAEPVRTATADLPQWVSERAAAEAAESAPAPAPAEETRPVYAEAVQALVTPQPAVLAPSAPSIETPAHRFEAPRRRSEAPVRSGPGRFAVQLGAYSSAASVERAWAQMLKRFGFQDLTPLSTTVRVPGRGTLHRLSVAGFASRDAAARTCSSIRGRGGACFVRTVAGDSPVRWASRYAARRPG